LSSGAEGHSMGEQFLEFGFKKWGENWSGGESPDFIANIPKKVFLDLGYFEGDYFEKVLGFLEVNQSSQSNLFIAKFHYRQLSKRDYRELDLMFMIV
jgi:hypothetical protein